MNETEHFQYLSASSTSVLLDELEQAMQSFKNTPARSYALALVNILLNNLDEAVNYLQEFTKERPQICFGQRRLGEVLIMRQEYKQAIEHLEKAIELFPGDHAAALWLTLAYYRMGEVEKAHARHDLLAGYTVFLNVVQDPSLLSTLALNKT